MEAGYSETNVSGPTELTSAGGETEEEDRRRSDHLAWQERGADSKDEGGAARKGETDEEGDEPARDKRHCRTVIFSLQTEFSL